MKKIQLWTILGCLLLNGFAFAADYKDWIPHFPNELDGLKEVSKGDGINMSSGNETSTTFTKSYGTGDKEIGIVITYSSGGNEAGTQQGMANMSFETDELVMKSIKVQGFEGIYQNDKVSNSVSISLFMRGKAMLAFSAPGGKPQKHYIDLLDKINLKKIAETF